MKMYEPTADTACRHLQAQAWRVKHGMSSMTWMQTLVQASSCRSVWGCRFEDAEQACNTAAMCAVLCTYGGWCLYDCQEADRAVECTDVNFSYMLSTRPILDIGYEAISPDRQQMT